MNKFYVYVYCDPRKSCNIKTKYHNFTTQPFYIGYGSKDRLYYHLNYKSNNKYKDNTITAIKDKNLSPIIFKIKEGLTQTKACTLEKQLIKILGTKLPVKGIKKGVLTNLTPGGTGGATMFNRKLTPKQKEKQRQGLIGRKFSLETRQNWSLMKQGKNNITEYQREMMVQGLRNMSSGSRRKISEGTRNTKWMYNPLTLERKRIKKDLITKHLDKGWLFGFVTNVQMKK